MRDFIQRLKDSLSGFMIGRNGADSLARASLIAALIMLVISYIIPNPFSTILSYAFFIYYVFRFFSKNVVARRAEDEKFHNLLNRRKSKKASNENIKNSKTTLYFKCDNCGQSLSVPKGKGTLKVTCPKCKSHTTIQS